MRRISHLATAGISFAITLLLGLTAHAQTSPTTARGDELVTEYFRAQTEAITKTTFSDIDTLDDWQRRRGQYREQLFDMLGLDPLAKRTPLKATITGTTEEDTFVVERLHFQSRPGLYVTGNLYRPKKQDEPLPAILYVCGHGRVKEDGVSYGNKVHYHHHGSWFARNGYVCLTIDTIQLGEIEGLHHGTYREKMWWWNNRGYTPAGVEAWNGIRAIDYLESRPEVDKDRIGVTGRSGGGAYSWWVAALDERVKCAVPVAGITSLENHVVDGCVEGHCDCMFMVNTFRWDYPMVAALVAPRPLLISNTDKDRIFPLEGVVDVHAKVRKVYDLYGEQGKLGLHITEGPHKDTQELRIHAFRWFNRHLRDDDTLVEKTAGKYFEPKQLKVFENELPEDEIVTKVHETFVPQADPAFVPDESELASQCEVWLNQLTEKTYGGWPRGTDVTPLNAKVVSTIRRDGVIAERIEFDSQEPYRLTLYAFRKADSEAKPKQIILTVVDQQVWAPTAGTLATVWPDHLATDHLGIGDHHFESWQRLANQVRNTDNVYVYFAPRGVGLTQWDDDERANTHIRRRFMQLGQTAATMQIWDVRRAMQALASLDGFEKVPRVLFGDGESAFWALHASLFEPNINQLVLVNLPTSNRVAPDLLNVSRFVQMPQLLLMASQQVGEVQVVLPPNAGDPSEVYGKEVMRRLQAK